MGEMSAIVLEFVEEGNEKADVLERQLILIGKVSRFAGIAGRRFSRLAHH
jgi:hypothetical protein